MNTSEKPEPSTCLTLRLRFWPLGVSVYWLARCLLPGTARASADGPALPWKGGWFQWHWKRIAMSIQREETGHASSLLSQSGPWGATLYEVRAFVYTLYTLCMRPEPYILASWSGQTRPFQRMPQGGWLISCTLSEQPPQKRQHSEPGHNLGCLTRVWD